MSIHIIFIYIIHINIKNFSQCYLDIIYIKIFFRLYKKIRNHEFMLNPIAKNFKGLVLVTGPTKSGKSQLGEFLIKDQESIIYIATSKPRNNDPEWQRRIKIHSARRPLSWKLIEHPVDICNTIGSIGDKQSILIDSLGGLVEQHLSKNEEEWDLFKNKLIRCLIEKDLGIVLVTEEIGWGIVPATPIGHLFRERHCSLSLLLGRYSVKQWLAINGIAIDLDKYGDVIP